MTCEISRAVDTHRQTLGAFMRLGGDAFFATTPVAELPESVAINNVNFTHFSLGRLVCLEDEFVGNGRERVEFTPQFTVALTNPSQEDARALNIAVKYAGFKLPPENVIGSRQIPPNTPLHPKSFAVARHETPHVIYPKQDILAIGMLGMRRERGPVVEAAGRVLDQTLSVLGHTGLQTVKEQLILV